MQIEPGQVALVTGAAGGLGLALARALAQAEMRVVLTDVDGAGAESAAADLRSEGLTVLAQPLDVRSREDWQTVAYKVEASWGLPSILCNNAGISALGMPAAEMAWDYWDLTLSINLDGVFNGIRTFLPRMLERAAPACIVNTASAASLGPIPANGAAYVASKYGVLGLSEALRHELAASTVRVSVLCPGAVATHLWRTTRRIRNLPAVDTPPPESAGRSGSPDAMVPASVAQRVLQAIRDDEFFILTHAHYHKAIQTRHAEIISAIEKL